VEGQRAEDLAVPSHILGVGASYPSTSFAGPPPHLPGWGGNGVRRPLCRPPRGGAGRRGSL